MFKRILKWFFGILALAAIIIAVFLINLIWFRPWSLNLFYEKVFAETVFGEPELLSQLGLVEQFGITRHNGKLNDESPAHQQKVIDQWKKDLAQLREYPLDRQTPSQKLSTHVLDWFLERQVEGAAIADRHTICHAAGIVQRVCRFAELRREINAGYVAADLRGDPARGSSDAAPNVEDVLAGLRIKQPQQFAGRDDAAAVKLIERRQCIRRHRCPRTVGLAQRRPSNRR